MADPNDLSQRTPSDLGTRSYQIGPEVIKTQGRGEDGGFDEVLLHAPGVSRETSGQFHLRGEDYGLQYRLNGIQLPEGIASSLGQSFDTRLIQTLTVSSGALPAQYGLRNAGVIELQTKNGHDLRGQEAGMYGGSHGTLHPSFSSGGNHGNADYFVTGSYLQNDLGTDNVTSSADPIHDRTQQYQGFALLTTKVGPSQKLSLILSGAEARFEIPSAPGLAPSFEDRGTKSFDSAKLDRNQREQSDYGIIAYQIDTPAFSLQAAEVNSYASTHYRPDRVGDLLFTGVASDDKRDLLGTGGQIDVAYRLGTSHTFRTGATFITQREGTRSTSNVFLTDPATESVVSTTPSTIRLNERRRGYLYGFYLQDEWRLANNLTLNAGGRFDAVNAVVHESQFSPRLSLSCVASPALTFYAGYAGTFTPPLLEYIKPVVFARFSGTTNAPDTLVDDAPRSERAHVFDLGVSYKIIPGLRAGVNAYYKAVRNMPDEEQLGSSLNYSPFTYEHGYKEGIELTAEYQRGAWLAYANTAFAQTKGRNINSSQGLFDSEELSYIATHSIHADYDQLVTVSAGAAYSFKTLILHTDLLFGSGFFGGFVNSQKLPSHYTLNLGASYTFACLNKVLVAGRFDIINATDQSYLLHSAGIGATVDQYSERRGFFGGVTCNF